MTLSLCMVVKNEERNLQQCLDSARDLAGELILVDTGSTDSTPSIAARYGAQVIPFDFTTIDFAAARNCAIAHAHHPWILMLDADETLDRAGAPMIADLVAHNENAGYFLERRNRWSESATPTTDYVVRLFPNRSDYRYRGRVHETIDASILAGGGRLDRSGIRLDHNFSADPAARRGKNHLYIGILKEEIAATRTTTRGSISWPRNITSLKCSMKPPKSPSASYVCVRWMPGRICSLASIICCTSPIWRVREPISPRH